MTEQTRLHGPVVTLRTFVTNVFLKPVREGRLRDVDWPPGLRPIVALALAGYATAVALVLTGGVIRATSVLFAQSTAQVPQPRWTVWLLFALIALALSLAQSGAVHAVPWLRWTITIYIVGTLLFVAFGQVLAPGGWAAIALASIAAVGIVVLVAVRGGRSFAWGEFAIVAGLVFSSVAVSIAAGAGGLGTGFDLTPLMLTSAMALLTSIAVPATIASGASVAELAVNSATWVAIALRDGLGRIALGVLIVALLVWRGFQVVPAVERTLADPAYELERIVGAIAFLTAIAAAWAGLRRLRRDRPAAGVPGLVDALGRTSLPIAAVLTPLVIITPMILIASVLSLVAPPLADGVWTLHGVLASAPAIGGMRALTGAGLLVLAVLLARRGSVAVPELFAAIGISSLVAGLIGAFGGYLLWDADSLSLVATAACVALLLWMLVTRTFSSARLTALAVALLAASLFANPQWLSDPLGVVLGSAAVAAVLVGFTWSLLTGYAAANGTSRGFPRPTRVLLLLANTVFATTVLAYVALSRDPGSSFDFAGLVELGQITFGIPLMACALLVAFAAFARQQRIVSAPEPGDAASPAPAAAASPASPAPTAGPAAPQQEG